MDVLSEVLKVVRLTGAIHFSGEFTHPWAFSTTPPQMLAARLKVRLGSVTPFHLFVDGSCWVSSGKLEPTRIDTGDVIIFPRGDQHVMASDPAVAPVPIKDIFTPSAKEEIAVLRHDGGGVASRFICGFLHADQQFDPLLNSLPALICVRVRGGVIELETQDASGRRVHPIDNRQEAEWWQASLRYLISEAAMPGPGNRAVLARLSESLFIEVLRWQLRFSGEGRDGWLAGLHDAQEAGMSRAALGKRFVELVGDSPIQYLASWRMHLARQLLRESTLGVGEIASRVGYESEAAFNRAFRRLVGLPLASWRHAETGVSAPL